MNALLDAFWRAAAYCLHPRVIGLVVVAPGHRRGVVRRARLLARLLLLGTINSGAKTSSVAPTAHSVISIWLYLLVFAFSALWFAHYAQAALERLRHDCQPAAPIDQRGPAVASEAPHTPGVLPSR